MKQLDYETRIRTFGEAPGGTPIPISALNQYAYCPRRCWWIHVVGEFHENAFTIEGKLLHQRVHTASHSRRDHLLQLRRVYVYSHKLGIAGFADLLEEQIGRLCPVEYKRGKRAAWKTNDHVQLCAQALCLEEMTSKEIQYGFLYYAASGRRQMIKLDDPDLRSKTIRIINDVHHLLAQESEPSAHYSKRCHGCSLYRICLPRETATLRALSQQT